MNLKVKNALISVSNKENLTSILKTLKKFNVNIISSGGTYASIKKLGYQNSSIFDILTKLNYKIYDLDGKEPLALKNAEYLLIHKKRNVGDIFKEK